jgi:hypothetical protein
VTSDEVQLLELIRTIAFVVLGAMLVIISVQVHKYVRRKDRLEFLRQRWAEQQQINIAQLNNPKNAAVFEKIVNGANHQASEDDNRRLYQAVRQRCCVRSYLFPKINGLLDKMIWLRFSGTFLNLIT